MHVLTPKQLFAAFCQCLDLPGDMIDTAWQAEGMEYKQLLACSWGAQAYNIFLIETRIF